MSARKTLFIAPPHRLDAFTATSVLADLLSAEPEVAVEIICRESDVAYFQDAPGMLKFLTYADDAQAGFGLMLQTMGRRWHRIVALAPVRLPFMLWARHRHMFRFASGSYALPSLFRPDIATSPQIWTPDKLHLALPETLAPDTPLILFAPQESECADWDWRHYAELAWRLADCVSTLEQAHIVVLATPECGIATGLMNNIPAGQITRFDNLPYAKQAALMSRAHVLVGTDQLATRLAPYAGAGLVLRLDRVEQEQTGRPYGLYVGHDASAVATYIQEAIEKTAISKTTTENSSAMSSSVEGSCEPDG